MKKKVKIIITIILAVISGGLVIAYFFLPGGKKVVAPTPSPSGSAVPTPSAIPISELPNDAQYAQSLTSIVKQYPWYPKLPIDTVTYHVIYDFDKNAFRIRLKTNVPVDQIGNVTQTAVLNIRQIGVPAPINYYVIDSNGNQL